MKSGKTIAAIDIWVLAFGFFLGLCILKFGDPVILDQKISPPTSISELISDSWPTHWANWIFFPLAAIVGAGAWFTWNERTRTCGNEQSDPRISQRSSNRGQRLPSPRPSPPGEGESFADGLKRRTHTPVLPANGKWLLILPLLWLGWQFISAARTVDANLTATTLWQFSGCVVCFFIGVLIFNTRRRFNFLLPGIFAALAVCLIIAVRQRIEFPLDTKFMIHEQNLGWTNLPPQNVEEMRRDQTIITTNGVDIVNPAILAKFKKGRVMGTMIYPNALAEIILLLFPVAFVLVIHSTRILRPMVRGAAVSVSVLLVAFAFYWSESKFGWLIAIVIGGLYLFRLPWPLKYKVVALTMVAVLGMGIFAVRFHTYFARGATSAVARLDYWRAAVQTTVSHPVFGTGPGTFQRPYAEIKSPDAEMARLAHNDYLEQFSDSGLPGGLFYCAWLAAALAVIGTRAWKSQDRVEFVLFLGLLGWCIQEFGEFGLYIPAEAWIAFMFLGCALAMSKVETLKS